jgi:hypothetical protein
MSYFNEIKAENLTAEDLLIQLLIETREQLRNLL